VYAGTSVPRAEQDEGLALMNGPDAERRAAAIIRTSKTGQDNVGEAFRDNLDPTNAGTRATRLSAAQREQLLGGVAEMSRLGDAVGGRAPVRQSQRAAGGRVPVRRDHGRVDRRARERARSARGRPQLRVRAEGEEPRRACGR
jgi:hypothetical protein